MTENLRFATSSQNAHNRIKKPTGSSKFIGVSFQTEDRLYAATIKKDGVKIYIGGSKDEEIAAQMYNKKAEELYGEFANLNIF